MGLALTLFPDDYWVCRFEVSERPILPEPHNHQFLSVTYTPLGECSVIANQQQLDALGAGNSEHDLREGPFKLLGINGQLDFSLTGVLHQLTKPLSEASIPIFTISTFDTDYVLINAQNIQPAIDTLTKSCLTITEATAA